MVKYDIVKVKVGMLKIESKEPVCRPQIEPFSD